MRLFQLDPQAVEPLPATFEPFAVGGEGLFAAGSSSSRASRSCPHVLHSCSRASERPASSASSELRRSAIRACSRANDCSRSSRTMRTLANCSQRRRRPVSRSRSRSDRLVLPAEFLLGRLDFLAGFLQMILLKADAVFEQIALLLEPGKLVAVLVFQPLPLVAQPRFALLDAAFEIDFDLRAGPFQLAAGALDLFVDAAAFLFDLVDLQFLERGQLVDRRAASASSFWCSCSMISRWAASCDSSASRSRRSSSNSCWRMACSSSCARCVADSAMLRRFESSSSSAARFAFQAARSRSNEARSSCSCASTWLRSVVRSISQSRAQCRGSILRARGGGVRTRRPVPAVLPRALAASGVSANRSTSSSRSTSARRLARSAAIWSRRPSTTRSCSSRSLISASQEPIFSFRSLPAGLEVGLPLEHVLFKLVDPHPGAAPLLVEQGVLLVECFFSPFELFAFGAEMGGNLRRLPQDFLFARREMRLEIRAAGRNGQRPVRFPIPRRRRAACRLSRVPGPAWDWSMRIPGNVGSPPGRGGIALGGLWSRIWPARRRSSEAERPDDPSADVRSRSVRTGSFIPGILSLCTFVNRFRRGRQFVVGGLRFHLRDRPLSELAAHSVGQNESTKPIWQTIRRGC